MESGLRTEHPDRDDRSVQGQRGNDRVESRSVGQPGIDHRRGLVDAAADPRDDAVDDLKQVVVVAEADLRLLDPPFFLDIDVLGPVDHDVADLVVLEQQLERTEAECLVEDLIDQPLALVAVQQRVFGVAELLDDTSDLVPKRLGVDLGDAIHVEPIDESHMDVALERFVLGSGRVDFLGGVDLPGRSAAGGGAGGGSSAAAAGTEIIPVGERLGDGDSSASSGIIRAARPKRRASESFEHRNRLPLEKCGEQFSSRLR